MEQSTLLEKVETLQNLLVAHATGRDADNETYTSLRNELLSYNSVSPLLPRFVRTCRDLSQFWEFIKFKFPTYSERRQYLWGEFGPLLQHLEYVDNSPIQQPVISALKILDVDHVSLIWERALQRLNQDPDGAITAARTLLESVCKNILDDLNVDYDDSADLPKLYRLTADSLNLGPSQHTEQVFRQILGGCQTVVEGLGAIRNRLGDAHGKGKQSPRPAPRHAELAVNLAGTMATFLVRTWDTIKNK